MRPLRLTRLLMPGSSLSPSQNVLQSSRKWRNILKQITINLDLDSTCRFDWCAGAIDPFKTGGSNGFEVVGIKSTINPCPQSLLLKIVGAGCAPPSEHNVAPSEANVSINLKELLWMVAGVIRCFPSETKKRSTLVWAVEALRMNAAIRGSLELAGLFRTKASKRFCAWVAVVIAEPIWS
jgi:hypothetical protein